MDDAIRIFRSDISPACRAVLRRLCDVHMYTDALTQERTHSSLAFGFLWEQRNGLLFTRQDERWTHYLCPSAIAAHSPPQPIYHTRQFNTPKQRVGILKGYFNRVLDCSNLPEPEIVVASARVASAMIDAGHSLAEIEKALCAAERESLAGLNTVRSLAALPSPRRRLFGLCYDVRLQLSRQATDLFVALQDLL